jgi:hypothetical protein
MPANYNPFSDLNSDNMTEKNEHYKNVLSYKDEMLAALARTERAAIDNISASSTAEVNTNVMDKIAALKTMVSGSETYDYDTEKTNLAAKNTTLMVKRAGLDNKIYEIQRGKNKETDPQRMLYASYFISILWTILATCLIYYIFTEL